MAGPTTVDEYLADLSADRRTGVEQLRTLITTAAPEAIESIAYQMPAMRSHGGQFLVSYAAFKAHYSLFPASEAVVHRCGDDIAPYLVGKGTIRFPANRPIPADLVTRIVKIRLEENAAHERR